MKIAIALALALSLSACAGSGGVKEQKQIATACAGITAAVNSIAAGVEAGKVSKADGFKALQIARPTAAFCEPKPAEHLGPADYAALLSAAADLATRKESIR